MGVVKRQVYNTQLMSEVDYSNIKCLKKVIKNLKLLQQLGEMGDQVALSIFVDIKTVLGGYGMHLTTLSPKQIKVIKLSLLHGYTHTEIAEMYTIGDRHIRYLIDSGLAKIQKQLTKGEKDE